jgi:membrane protease YdiL (CAAX protease family)
MQHVTEMMMNPTSDPDAKLPLLIMQAGGTLFGFILAPLLHLRLIDQKRQSTLFHAQYLDITLLAVTFAIMIAFMIANSVVIDWNMNIDFGQFSTSFEEWARAKEEQLSELTKYLTKFDNAGGLFAGLIVIAVLPAIGEEIVFRGVLQRKLYHIADNPHVAIWIAAILFSAIHFQFYGFFPRMLLGALFGYIYYWSGNLWYPIFAHFVNNGFTLIMLYLYQQKATDIDLEATDAVPWGAALIAFVVGAALLFYFKGIVSKFRRSYHGQ